VEKLFIWVISILLSWMLVLLIPVAAIWALNTVFALNIAYNVGTIAAMLVLIIILMAIMAVNRK
jgi:hypothetical protein